MAIYLIRHTAPDIVTGTCYGQSDIGVIDSFHDEAAIIKDSIPDDIQHIYSSPLKRCQQLATHLFPTHTINLENDLMEIHCGEWEMRLWDDIPWAEVDPWMNDFVNRPFPGGESYMEMHKRVTNCFTSIVEKHADAAIIAHGGVIRSILSHLTNTPLIDSFKVFRLHYGCVIRIEQHPSGFEHSIISNIESGSREKHKPSHFKR
jgi:alpha-ribazole phosphatase